MGVSLSMCVANISVSLGLSRFLAFRCCFVCSAPVDTRAFHTVVCAWTDGQVNDHDLM